MLSPYGINLKGVSLTLEYELLTAHIDDFEEMSYTTYGICVRDKQKNIVFDHADISTSKAFVQGFIDLIKDHDIAPSHIEDVLEDYLD